MKTHLIKNGIIVNTIVASVEEAKKAFPDKDCIEATAGGIGWRYEDEKFITPVEPEPDPAETAKIEEQYQKAQAIEEAKTDLKKAKDDFKAEGKSISMAYLDKRLTAIETILGVS